MAQREKQGQKTQTKTDNGFTKNNKNYRKSYKNYKLQTADNLESTQN